MINERLQEKANRFIDRVVERYSFATYTMDMGIFDLEFTDETDVRRTGREYGFKFLIDRILRIERTFKRNDEVTDDDLKDIFYSIMAKLFNVETVDGELKTKLDEVYPVWVKLAKKFEEAREKIREERLNAIREK